MMRSDEAQHWSWLFGQWWGFVPPWRWTGETQIVWNPESFGGPAAPTYYEEPVYDPTANLPEDVAFEHNGERNFHQFEVQVDSQRTYSWEVSTSHHSTAPLGQIPWNGRWRYFEVILEQEDAGVTVQWHVDDADVFLLEDGLGFMTPEWAAAQDRPRQITYDNGEFVSRLHDDDRNGEWDLYYWGRGRITHGRVLDEALRTEVGELELLSPYDDVWDYVVALLGERPLVVRQEDVKAAVGEMDFSNIEDVQKQLDSYSRYLGDPEVMIDG